MSMRHGAEQVQQGSRIVLIVHDLVGEEVAAGGGLRWESEMGEKERRQSQGWMGVIGS